MTTPSFILFLSINVLYYQFAVYHTIRVQIIYTLLDYVIKSYTSSLGEIQWILSRQLDWFNKISCNNIFVLRKLIHCESFLVSVCLSIPNLIYRPESQISSPMPAFIYTHTSHDNRSHHQTPEKEQISLKTFEDIYMDVPI